MEFKRITKKEAQTLFAQGKPVYLNPCKFMPSTPFNQACLILGKEYLDKAAEYGPKGTFPNEKLWKGTVEQTAWDLMYNNWAFYNATYETGYYAHYYVESN